MVEVNYTGRATWSFGGNLATLCLMHMTYYPLDIHKCDIEIVSWGYTQDAVNISSHLEKLYLTHYKLNMQWDLMDTKVQVMTHFVESKPDHVFPKVKFSVMLYRKASYYFINIITPALYCISISMMVFWLPPESGEKISLGITVLLSFTVFQLVVAENTPRTSDHTPMLSKL